MCAKEDRKLWPNKEQPGVRTQESKEVGTPGVRHNYIIIYLKYLWYETRQQLRYDSLKETRNPDLHFNIEYTS